MSSYKTYISISLRINKREREREKETEYVINKLTKWIRTKGIAERIFDRRERIFIL